MKAAIIFSSTRLHPDKLFIALNFFQICAVPEQRHSKRCDVYAVQSISSMLTQKQRLFRPSHAASMRCDSRVGSHAFVAEGPLLLP